MMQVTKLSETTTTITLGWTPPSGVEWYLFYAAGTRISNAAPVDKNGNVKSSIKFSKGKEPYVVVAVIRQGGIFSVDTGTYVTAPPPPPPKITKIYQRKSDFSFFWNEGPTGTGAGVSEISTPHGNGMQYIVDQTTPAPWEVLSKMAGSVHSTPASQFIGQRQVWTWYEYFSTAGNPSGFPTEWTSGVLLEFQVGWGSIGPHLVITNGSGAGPTFRIGIEKPGIQYDFFNSQAIAMDTWIPMRWEIVWSETAGYQKWTIDGVDVVESNAATLFNGGGVTGTIICFYSSNLLSNQRIAAAMQYVVV